MQVTVGSTVVAEVDDDDIIHIEGNPYVPRSALTGAAELQRSDRQYTCPWKGPASYWDLVVDGTTVTDGAWSYDDLKSSAVDRVGQDFQGYLAFDRAQVQVS